jgi:hypothetical protein
MKRALLVFLTVFILVLSVFSLCSCEKKVRVDLLGYYRDGVVVTHEDGNSIIRFYKNPSFEYDVADFEKVKMKIAYYHFYNTTAEEEVRAFGYPPENARGNPELQYFEVVLENTRVSLEKPVIHRNVKGVLIPEESDKLTNNSSTPSILMTFVIGLIVTVVAGGAAVFGLNLWDDPQGRFIVIAANILPIFLNIGSYILWGAGRGIILSFFCAAIVGITIAASRIIDC